MKRTLFVLLIPLTLVACGTAAGAPNGGGSSPQAAAAVSSRGGSLDPILIAGHGKTLNLFEADTRTQSTCSGACAQAWPPRHHGWLADSDRWREARIMTRRLAG